MMRWGDDQQYISKPLSGGPKVKLLHATSDPLGVVAAMAGVYKGEIFDDLKRISEQDRIHYFEEVHRTHLQAPFEAIQFLFLIEGVDRSFTHQMVRSRMFTFAQESLRFAVVEDLTSRVDLPPSIAPGTVGEQEWLGVIERIEDVYTTLVNSGVPAEDARGLLPHATQTRLMVRCDYRNLLKTAGDRLCTQAQFVWRKVFSQMIHEIRQYPFQPSHVYLEEGGPGDSQNFQHVLVGTLLTEGHFAPVCYGLGHCPFTADFDRRCTIRERVQEGRFEDINPHEWLLNPAAARSRT
jgi:flavin-dependent thymidylate synthase